VAGSPKKDRPPVVQESKVIAFLMVYGFAPSQKPLPCAQAWEYSDSTKADWLLTRLSVMFVSYLPLLAILLSEI